ncbi:rhodanese-like domain-containing protein [Natronobacterium gregoryi]|uniref:Rhodanese n=2 Tax=Natronobacterium gregoryi TaxID=44930 RepID=L0AK33_NATGS|nr:rhodanese-like domain-containing protein [Natronobacterium gregoryi]AFZ73542.1 Rhodanese-related sulfurtransferase [Natronobacterium gregoryi SP2]ELY68209.1 rhodanese [Natronobacterium gregoryi SP2]PLK20557.1 rhodanese-like domain-containing protein [Natronobacterium gregoryi SP2]SFJ17231.1 Rhodanese-related sulfurtransferase [Natronobacterium gregoryi]
MDGEITPDEVKALLEADADVRLVDIRDRRRFEHSRIPGSENVPFHELANRVAEFEDDNRVVTVCPHGKDSVRAARLIASATGTTDVRVQSMAGGLEKYGLKFGLAAGDEHTATDAGGDASADGDAPF